MGHRIAMPTAEQVVLPADHPWRKFPAIGGVLGVLCLAGAWFASGNDHHQFYFSYLVAFLFAVSIALGAMFFTLIQFAARAGWSVVVRRTAENLMAPLPFFFLLWIPLYLGRHELYHWTHAEAVAHDAILASKAWFLNDQGFLIRAVVYFLGWTGIVWYFRQKSIQQDSVGGTAITRQLQNLSYPCIAFFALTISLAAIDWAMSLDPHWYSTMWGVYFFAGSIVSAFSLIALFHLRLHSRGILEGVVNAEHYHDLGKLVFAFTVFWAYVTFSQYFLIWYANIPEETMFYSHRAGTWSVLGAYIMAGHFGVPFLYMLNRTVKRIRWALAVGCVWMLVFHYIDLYYIIMPIHHHHGIHVTVVDLLCLLGIVGLYAGLVSFFVSRSNLIPTKDPRLGESMSFVNF